MALGLEEQLNFMKNQNDSLEEVIRVSERFVSSPTEIFASIESFQAERSRLFRKLRLMNSLYLEKKNCRTLGLDELSGATLDAVRGEKIRQQEYLDRIKALDDSISQRISNAKAQIQKELRNIEQHSKSIMRFKSTPNQSGMKLDGVG